jgi:hypothetical protein
MRSSRRDPLGALFSRLILVGLVLLPASARAQAIEVAGSRAPGMGGAFVAVASDSSATWWNPAGLAAGPFLDFAIYRNALEGGGQAAPAWRARLLDFSLGTPPAGISYYRFRLTDVQPLATTATGQGDRQSTRTGAIRSIPASQLGVTLAHSLISGIHVGATLKYVRASVMAAAGEGSSDQLLDAGDELDGADSHGTFDFDLGAIAVSGPFRAGAVVRNARQAGFGDGVGITLPRQVRVGGAFDGEAAGVIPLTVSVDVDVQRYDGPGGERRVIAAGAEDWLVPRRFAVRAGARFNSVGANDRALTAGSSVAVRSGLYVDAHVVYGGAADERGWGVAARVSF